MLNIIIIFFKLILEFLNDFWLLVVGQKRNKVSFERKQKLLRPIKTFLNKKLNLKLKDKEFKEFKDEKSYTRKIISLAFLILLILLIRHCVIEPYKIPTGSMIPTMKIGDHLFVNKLSYGLRLPFLDEVLTWDNPKRGDIVIFKPPVDNGKIYVKRIVGLPGDTIKVEDNKFYVNGVQIIKTLTQDTSVMKDLMDQNKYSEENYDLYNEDYFGLIHYVMEYKHRDYLYMKFNFEIKVPDGSYFMMGDNRDNSEDSRVWGFVPRNQIFGKVMFVWLSLNWDKAMTIDWLRYNRFGKIIK